MIQLIIGLNTEGTTDIRFMQDIIKRLFEEIAYECKKEIEIYDIIPIKVEKENFIQTILNASKKGLNEFSISVLCVHADADGRTTDNVMNNKFNPLLEKIKDYPSNEYCKYIIPVIPVTMMESWMLADKDLFKTAINAIGISNQTLGIEKDPETYADPKDIIEKAIRKANEGKTKRKRYSMSISELYEYIGKNISLDSLRNLSSFSHFEEYSKTTFHDLGYL